MTNSIRSPRPGKTAWSKRIAKAVDDEDWQDYRLGMKGRSTTMKLHWLKHYFEREHAHLEEGMFFSMELHLEGWGNCDFCIRVDNYIKALCRGGQLYPGESLLTAVKSNWKLDIKKD